MSDTSGDRDSLSRRVGDTYYPRVQFPCARCGRTYEIADELVVGRAVKVACPACGNLVVHRVPAPGGAAAAPAAQPPRPPELASAFADADDDDFDNALAALEGPHGTEQPASAPPPVAPVAPRGADVSAAAAAASPARSVAAPPRPPAPSPARAPAKRPAARPPVAELSDEEVPTVTAELVLIRRSARRSRMTAAAVAIVVVGALVGVGAMGLKWKRGGPAGGAARRDADAAAGGSPSGGGLSAADLAKLMGKSEEALRAAERAPAPRAQDRPRHEKLPVGDKGLLDLLAKKGDVAVTVQDEDAVALATTRGTLDSEAIEGTLSRNSSSFAACVSRAVSSDPEQRLAAGRVSLELTIRPSGRVQRAGVADKAVAGSPLGRCIAQAAKRMVFPGFDGEPIDIVVPLKLKVGF